MQESILDRATFEEQTISLSANIKPGQTERVYHELAPNQFYCIQEASWKYGVEANEKDSYGWPKTPLKVTILGAVESRIESPVKIAPPRLLSDSVQVEIHNPSGVGVRLHITIVGTMVSCKNGTSVSAHEAIGYVMLDSNQRGLLALGGNQKSLEMTLNAFIKQLPVNKEALSLPVKNERALIDEGSLVSTMIGDLITFQEENPDIQLNVKQIRELSKYLIAHKWLR